MSFTFRENWIFCTTQVNIKSADVSAPDVARSSAGMMLGMMLTTGDSQTLISLPAGAQQPSQFCISMSRDDTKF